MDGEGKRTIGGKESGARHARALSKTLGLEPPAVAAERQACIPGLVLAQCVAASRWASLSLGSAQEPVYFGAETFRRRNSGCCAAHRWKRDGREMLLAFLISQFSLLRSAVARRPALCFPALKFVTRSRYPQPQFSRFFSFFFFSPA